MKETEGFAGKNPLVVYICGAGGKTSYIRKRARLAAKMNQSVLITTTTHMMRPADLISDPASAEKALVPGQIVTAGLPDPAHPEKMIGFPSAVRRRVAQSADLVLIEADGARHKEMKVPFPWEPVVEDDADELIVLYGARASGRRISETCYNPEGVLKILDSMTFPDRRTEDDPCLTEEQILRILKTAYQVPAEKRFPGIRVQILKGTERTWHFILLAAGFSSRFGGNKLLYPVSGKPMYRHLADRLLHLVNNPSLTGHVSSDLTVVTQYEEIRDALLETKAEVVINPDPSRGISSSLKCALRHLADAGKIEGDDFVVAFPADQPYLTESTVSAFLSALSESGMRLGCVCDGVNMRSPCAFAAEYIPALMRLNGDTGGKRILMENREDVFLFRSDHAEELEDIDCL